MSRWRWPGYLDAEVPDDWVIEDLGDAIEIRPPGANGALHISIVRAPTADVSAETLEMLVDGWADPRNSNDFVLEGTEEADGIKRAWAHWQSIVEGQPAEWTISAVGARSRVAVGTYVGLASDAAGQRAGRAILASIRPDESRT